MCYSLSLKLRKYGAVAVRESVADAFHKTLNRSRLEKAPYKTVVLSFIALNGVLLLPPKFQASFASSAKNA